MPKIDLLVEEFYLISDYLDFFNEGKLLGELFSILVNCCCDAENPNHKISNTKSLFFLSKLPVGSSPIIINGSFIKARAIATRCF